MYLSKNVSQIKRQDILSKSPTEKSKLPPIKIREILKENSRKKIKKRNKSIKPDEVGRRDSAIISIKADLQEIESIQHHDETMEYQSDTHPDYAEKIREKPKKPQKKHKRSVKKLPSITRK